LPYVLTALEPTRDGITLIVEELDPGAFDDWLPPLLNDLPKRGWSIIAHLEGGERLSSDEWPESRRWGPPRTPAFVLGELALAKRSFRSVLLRVKGAYAGIFLALESGLHRTIYPKRPDAKGDDRLHVYVHRVAQETDIPAAAWDHLTLVPPAAASAATRRKMPVMRERDRVEGVLRLAGKRRQIDLDVGAYWARIEEIALEHLLLFEAEDSGLDRDAWLSGPVEQG
ncbi:MAG: hypothetical protein ABI193_01690, partial [Minicystis sp.]